MARAGYARVTKRRWLDAGGLSNPRCYRRQVRGAWHYFIEA
jgi:hypothetical protein